MCVEGKRQRNRKWLCLPNEGWQSKNRDLWQPGAGYGFLPCTHVACVQHEDAARGLCLIHDWSKGKVILVQGDLQGLAAATKEEEGAQEAHAFHEHFLGEGRDALLWGEGDFHFTDLFGLQSDVLEGLKGDDLGEEQLDSAAEGGSRVLI